jgi:NitT/TauT family transport system substrate-binding protein
MNRGITLSVCITLGMLIACASPAVPSGESSQRMKLKVGYSSPTNGPSPVWVAKEAGFFANNGLDVETIFIDGGTKTAQALIANSITFAAIAPSAPINAVAGGADLVIVAGLVNTLDQDFIVIPEIKTGADLKGKKIAVSGPSSSTATAVRIALRELYKLDPDKDVVIVTIGTDAEREAALLTKQIAATVLVPDSSVKAKKDGLIVLDNLWNKGIAYQGSSIAVRKTYLKEHPDVATRFLKSIVEAIGYIKDPTHKPDVIKIFAKYLSFSDVDVLESAYTRTSNVLLQCAPYVTLDGMKTVMGESKPAMDKGMTAEQMVDNSLVKALEDSGFIKQNCK